MAKESLYTPDTPKQCILRLPMTDEYTVRRQGGVPTNVTFEDGKFIPAADGCYIRKPLVLSGTYSIRMKIGWSVAPINQIVMDFRQNGGEGYFFISGTGTFSPSSGTKYINGELYNGEILQAKEYDLVVSGISLKSSVVVIGSSYTYGASLRNGYIELVEIYNYALTAEEVANLYNSTRYKPLSTPAPILDIRADAGIYDAAGNTITNNGVEVVKDGDVRVLGVGSLVSSYSGTYRNKSFVFWLKRKNLNAIQPIASNPAVNTKFRIQFSSYERIDIGNGSTYQTFLPTLSRELNIWHQIIITENDDGKLEVYEDGVKKYTSSNVLQYSYDVGEYLVLGSNTGGVFMSGVRIYDGYIDEIQASQLYTNEKHLYQK